MGIVRFLSVRLVEVTVILLLILFMPNIPPNVNFTHFKVSAPQNLEGKLALNNRLNSVEHLFENELKGPEAFAEYNGELYTSLHTGDVVKISKGHIIPVVKFGKPCTGFIEETICGRPLGLQFDKNGVLYVADAYMGIWKVNVKSGQKTLLIPVDAEIEGKAPKIPNSLAVSENGDIYWTDSSTDFKLEDGVYTMLADGSGRVIHYDAKTRTNKVLMDGIHFANGIILSDDEEFIVISETARSRLYRFWLKGAKKGTHDIFADRLPGMPDNLNSDGKGGFLVPLVLAADSENPAIPQIIGPFPLIRKLISRIFGLIELGFKTVDRIYPNIYAQTAVHWVGHFESMLFFIPERTTILHISKSGDIIESFHTMDKSISSVSDAFIFGENLYLGSPYNNYIGRISLEKIGLGQFKRIARETAFVKQTPPSASSPTQAPTKQTPTTTTPPPKPTQAPVKPTQAPPKPTQAPPKPTQAPAEPAQAPLKPTQAPAKPTQAPTKPTQAPTKPTQAPAKSTQTPPKPTQAPAKPTQAPVKPTTETTRQPTTQTPQASVPQVKQAASQTASPNKQTTQGSAKPPASPSTDKQTPPSTTKQEPKSAAPTQKSSKDEPKEIPNKENSMPKSKTI